MKRSLKKVVLVMFVVLLMFSLITTVDASMSGVIRR